MAKSAFMEMLRSEMRLRGYAHRTEKTYLYWIRHFIRYHQLKHPQNMSGQEVKSFLTWLATEKHVAPNTQKVALNSLVFMFQKVLNIQLGDLGFTLAQHQRRLPVVLTGPEVLSIINSMNGKYQLIIELLYGSGLRINECLRLRVKDVCLQTYALTVRDGKGNKDRQTLLSRNLKKHLSDLINSALDVQANDNKNGIGPSLPPALSKKYPNAYRSPGWMYLFPSPVPPAH